MDYFVVYFTTGEIRHYTGVINTRRVWRNIAKICNRWGCRVEYLYRIRNCTKSDLNALYGTACMREVMEVL